MTFSFGRPRENITIDSVLRDWLGGQPPNQSLSGVPARVKTLLLVLSKSHLIPALSPRERLKKLSGIPDSFLSLSRAESGRSVTLSTSFAEDNPWRRSLGERRRQNHEQVFRDRTMLCAQRRPTTKR